MENEKIELNRELKDFKKPSVWQNESPNSGEKVKN